MSQQDMQPSSEGHQMSIALIIGGTIALIGVIILLYGLFGGASYSMSEGINFNLWWGLGMVIFGLLMSAGSYFSGKRTTGK
ncbi:hypothetical protein [Tengunoibacter tsumagoiensis]|uniref:Uncharacterized protein n=1 Tax=Tengunoibacter tsumagoiensis TaxID=2014871 RepID=A0A401ZY01_9CHLR|nr:hypothetical protein [Tengunoibacter tsumagoiensis]GCE11748.1 hypothetical protein KTT_16070 [Tengunoibacter tsumagoiensis]